LRGAKNFNAWRTDDLRMLLDQPGKLRAYKLVGDDYKSLNMHGGSNPLLDYSKGNTVEVKDADKNEETHCGAGVNLGTFAWVAMNWREGYRIMLVEFHAKDIAAIPFGNDGKFRVTKCKVIKEIDLAERGIVAPKKAEAK